jgi:hypothetical protein
VLSRPHKHTLYTQAGCARWSGLEAKGEVIYREIFQRFTTPVIGRWKANGTDTTVTLDNFGVPGSVPLASLLLCERPLAYTRTIITRVGLQLESTPCIGMRWMIGALDVERED